jgi:tetratricopeptide (TPR) repeat protein
MHKQNSTTVRKSTIAVMVLLLLTLQLSNATLVFAQTPDTYQADRERAIGLLNANQFAEALPLFEKLAAVKPNDSQVQYGLGLSVLLTSDKITDPNARRQARIRARTALLRARELGVRDENLEMMLKSVKADGGEAGRSDNQEANAAMEVAGRYFASNELEKAAKEYERAALLDPKLYEAALYTGNTYYSLKNWDKAGEWFTRAIALDANREIAHRYWGDALMLSGKDEAARDKFLDAIIAEPYSQLAWRGLIQWAQRNQVTLAHPKIVVQGNVSPTATGATITLDPGSLSGKNDGSAAWVAYGLIRAGWLPDKTGKLSDKFAKAYPGEKTYRHSLAEEMDALRLVIESLKEQMKGKDFQKPEPSLANLLRLYDAGMLEPFILLTRADPGLEAENPTYRAANRDKLRRYLLEYVIARSSTTY